MEGFEAPETAGAVSARQLKDSAEKDVVATETGENGGVGTSQVPLGWPYCLDCEMWVAPVDGRYCSLCGRDTFDGGETA